MCTRDIVRCPSPTCACHLPKINLMCVVHHQYSQDYTMHQLDINMLVRTSLSPYAPRPSHKPFHDIFTPFLPHVQLIQSLIVMIIKIRVHFEICESYHCSYGHATWTFQYTIKAPRQVGCHCPITLLQINFIVASNFMT